MFTRKRVLVVHSPASGRATQLPQALKALDECGMEIIQVIPVSNWPLQPAQSQNWIDQGVEVVIAAGGDGVIGSVISQIAGSSLLLGILPLGTANDIARSLDIPLDLSGAARVIATGQTRRIDVGVALPLNTSGQSSESTAPLYGYFAHALTIGLNVKFAQMATDATTRKRYGRLTYPVATSQALRNSEILPVHLQFEGLRLSSYPADQHALNTDEQIEAQGTTQRYRVLQVTVANAPIFGGAWNIPLPNASLDDGVLDILVFEAFGSDQLSARLASLFNSPPLESAGSEENGGIGEFFHHPAELTRLPGLHHLQAQGITISTEQDPQPVTLDGEIRGQTPLHVKISKHFLPVLVPETQSSGLKRQA